MHTHEKLIYLNEEGDKPRSLICSSPMTFKSNHDSSLIK